MKITAAKVKRELLDHYGWDGIISEDEDSLMNKLIKDTLKVVDEILKKEKNKTIK